MKRLVSAVLAMVLLLSLTGCKKKITSGEVAEKNFEPAYTTIQLIPIVLTNGDSTTTMFVPFTYHYTDSWKVKIQRWNEKTREMESATYRVTEAVYDEIQIGAEFVYDESMQPAEPEYTREKLKEDIPK